MNFNSVRFVDILVLSQSSYWQILYAEISLLVLFWPYFRLVLSKFMALLPVIHVKIAFNSSVNDSKKYEEKVNFEMN